MASSRKEIRKWKVLSIEQKLEICELVKKGTIWNREVDNIGYQEQGARVQGVRFKKSPAWHKESRQSNESYENWQQR